jgi:hypothetical protein
VALGTQPERRRLRGIELAMFGWSRVSPLNIVAVIALDGPSLAPVLPRVLATLQRRHPLLRARVTGGRGGWAFESHPAGSSAVGAIPLKVLPPAGGDVLPGVIAGEMNTGFDHASGPLARVTYVEEAGSSASLVLTLHHCVSDAVGAGSLVSELLDGCRRELSGEDGALPPLELPPPMPELIPARHRGAGGLKRALAFMGAEAGDELRLRRGTRGMRRDVPPPGRASALTLELTPGATTDLVSWSRRRRLTMTSVLNAALLWEASARLHGGRPRPMRALVWIDLRPHLDPPPAPENLASYHSMVRLVVHVDRREGFEALARRVQEVTAERAARGDGFSAAILSPVVSRAVMRSRSQRMGTTAISYGGAQHVRASYGPIEVRAVRAFISNNPRGAEIAATAGVTRGSLCCNLLYVDSELSEAEVGAIRAGLAATLAEASRS